MKIPEFATLFDGDFNLTFGAIRRQGNDTFNDDFFLSWVEDGDRHEKWWKGTTTKGSSGTLILPPGVHKGLWKPGMHKNTYPCLVQAREVEIIREDTGKTQKGYFGLQCHHSGNRTDPSKLVGPWSRGCQVSLLKEDHEFLMLMVARQKAHGHGEKLSYYLSEE